MMSHKKSGKELISGMEYCIYCSEKGKGINAAAKVIISVLIIILAAGVSLMV